MVILGVATMSKCTSDDDVWLKARRNDCVRIQYVYHECICVMAYNLSLYSDVRASHNNVSLQSKYGAKGNWFLSATWLNLSSFATMGY